MRHRRIGAREGRTGVVWLVAAAGAVTAVVMGALTWAAYSSLRDREQSAAADRSRSQAAVFVELTAPPSDDGEITRLVDAVSDRSDVDAIVVTGDEVITSRPDLDGVPAEVAVGVGMIGRGEVTIGGERYVAYGGSSGPGREAYLLVTAEDDEGTVTGFQPFVVAAWAASVLAAAGGAALLSRARLRRVAAARERERMLTADIAHEIRTPLATVMAAASWLDQSSDTLPGELQRPVSAIASESRRLRRLVEDLLELARLESGDNGLHPEAMVVGEVVRSVVEVRDTDGRVAVHVGDDVVVEIDRLCFTRIVLNLVENALHHGEPPITVSVRREGGGAVLEVVDAGPGIPPERLSHLFDRSASSAGGHSGFGLPIARRCAELLGGRLRVTSRLGEGTTFTLRIPGRGRPTPPTGEPDGS